MAALPNPPVTTHQWLRPLYLWLKSFVTAFNAAVGGAASWTPVRVLTAGALPANTWTLATQTKLADANGALVIDGVTMAAGDRFWDNHDGTGLRRGLFVVVAAGAVGSKWSATRAADADESADFIDGKTFGIGEGTQAGQVYGFTTNAPFTLNTTTPVIARETGVVHVDDTQTITGSKRFIASALAVWNAAATFLTRFESVATAERVITFPDATATMAQAGIATGASGTGATGGTAPGLTDPTHNHVQNAHLHALTDPQHNHGGATGGTAPGLTDPQHNHGGATGAAGTGATDASGTGAVTGATAAEGTGATGGTAAVNQATALRQSFAFSDLPSPGTNYHAAYAAGAPINDVAGPWTMPFPRRTVQVALGAIGANPVIVTINGTAPDGSAVSDAISCAGVGTYQGVRAFDTITSVTSDVDPLDTVTLQTGNGFGVEPFAALQVISVDGVVEAAASSHGASGTIVPTTVPNAIRDFAVRVTVSHLHVQDSHTHLGPSHTHAAGTLAGPSHMHLGPSHTHTVAAGATGATVDSHTHTVAAGSTGATVDNATAVNVAAATGATVNSHTHTGPSHTHLQS